MNRLGLGLAALGRPAYINVGRSELPPSRSVDAMRDASWAVLDAAYEAGVRWVDVARSYGLAEEFLAGWLASRSPDDVTVSSKWGYAYVGDWRLDAAVHEEKSHTLDRFRTQWGESSALLGSHLALYQVHSLTPDSPLFDDPALQDALAALPVRVGFSTSGPGQADVVRRALALERHGVRVFTAVQSTWNILEPSVGPALAEAHEAGAHVLVKEGMANGRLAVEPPEPVAALARSLGVGPDAVALAAVLAQPWAETVLSGAAGTQQLASNLVAAGIGEVDLPSLAEPAAVYWKHRSALAWA
ncbi:aldo/keto reductase [Actinophytocola oryzae]|uniref:Aryl-alcohol dehydrogenase-like predicted oxidoreductase n=1 Tax=Actinophytocola oryzae TaxID=502181 RepID=A0A4R7V7D3_9PSEU|nr:aldo/keto reductase [Actinophytocola oryzae]TDV44904.1 aryl-alcohol dehydrogenase-like predicted oxidoreductase [Actinophytocola oryzae]